MYYKNKVHSIHDEERELMYSFKKLWKYISIWAPQDRLLQRKNREIAEKIFGGGNRKEEYQVNEFQILT